MVAKQLIVAAFAAAASASALAAEEAMFANLLKRQAPGTPAYDCHDNCGTAITLSKQPNPCDNEAFQTNYENCLICSGPDNYNIWRYYGGTLSTAGSSCGLETEPKSGKQPDVGPAVHPASSSSAAPPASTPAASSPAASSPAASATPAPSSGSPSTAPPAPSSTPAGAVSSVVTPTPSLSQSASGAPSRSANGTASFTVSSPPEVSTNAAAVLGAADAARVFGAVFVGAMFGL